jgi:hypothetical protein
MEESPLPKERDTNFQHGDRGKKVAAASSYVDELACILKSLA